MIVLASASASRRAMLEGAGVDFAAHTASIDEQAIKDAMAQDGCPAAQVSEMLAELKALRVSTLCPGIIVLGADQMLECEGQWFDKPESRDDAAAHLRFLRGKTHQLISSVVAVRDGHRLWHATDTARLTMRTFSDDFLTDYLDRCGDRLLSTVGAYQLEGLGSQLFRYVQGDYFTILGMPLLAVLDFLRENGEIIP